jgi:hypothetical protein
MTTLLSMLIPLLSQFVEQFYGCIIMCCDQSNRIVDSVTLKKHVWRRFPSRQRNFRLELVRTHPQSAGTTKSQRRVGTTRKRPKKKQN